MTRLLCFPGSIRNDPAVDAWMKAHPGDLGTIAKHWFDVIRSCGDEAEPDGARRARSPPPVRLIALSQPLPCGNSAYLWSLTKG